MLKIDLRKIISILSLKSGNVGHERGVQNMDEFLSEAERKKKKKADKKKKKDDKKNKKEGINKIIRSSINH